MYSVMPNYVNGNGWQLIKTILPDVAALAASERQNYLDSAGLDASVRGEIESLLSLGPGADDFLSFTAGDLAYDFVVDEDLVGRRIGRYEIVAELGVGGMGAVYLAERADGDLKQRVAIKMLRREFNTKEFRLNFEREKAIHARLEHPNIARPIDAGTTDEGVPFLVMEYVDGTPIDRYCETRGLGLTERLKLFNKACDAVAFAHQNLIVHRDLKPSNILVTADGMPKLLDFGISKLLADGEPDQTGLTLHGAMTPEYASPEQIEGSRVTTATDVYSLGVVLYKLLTGRLPSSSGEAAPRAKQNEAIRPSRAAGPGSQISASRLRGDLDNIVLKALDRDPARRYVTVQQFREDLWRHVDGHPVQARRPTFSYRLAKSIRRNKLAAAAALLVIMGATAAVWQADVANGQARIAAFETEKARSEELRSSKISKFMFRVFSYANPSWHAEGARMKGNARVIDAMMELSGQIDAEFANEPDVAAELNHRFGDVMLNYPELQDRARRHFLRALELRRSFYGDRHELLAKDMYYASLVGVVESDRRAAYLLDAIEMMQATNPDNLNHPYMIEDYVSRMLHSKYPMWNQQFEHVLAERTGRDPLQISEEWLVEADRVFRIHYSEDNPAIRSNICRLAYVQFRLGKEEESSANERLCRVGVPDPMGGPPFLAMIEQEKYGRGR